MSGQRPIDPNHVGPQSFLRVAGPLTMLAGGLFMLVGAVDFFSCFGEFGRTPTLFWCLFVGMPLLAIGGGMTKLGYMGRIMRYLSQEATPVATDTFNYAARETKEGIRNVAQAIGEGLHGPAAAGALPASLQCPCGYTNEPGARYCSQCGQSMTATQVCSSCQHENDAGARFCDHCGQALSTS